MVEIERKRGKADKKSECIHTHIYVNEIFIPYSQMKKSCWKKIKELY